jgi:hypothetical protein
LDLAILCAKTKAAALVVLSYSKSEISSFEELVNKALASCSQLVITTMFVFKNRIRVILVGEWLGF